MEVATTDPCIVRGQDALVHERAFSNSRLYVKLEDCRVVVRWGGKDDSYYTEERLLACLPASAEGSAEVEGGQAEVEDIVEGGRRRATHYTYVALWFDKAYLRVFFGHRKSIAVTKWGHHITLAYLPLMSSVNMDLMARDMKCLLDDWIALEHSRRPLNLLTSRSFWVLRRACDFVGDVRPRAFDRWPGSEDIYTYSRSDFLNTGWEEICQLVDDGLLVFVHEPRAITKEKERDDTVPTTLVNRVCASYAMRDLERQESAKQVERESLPKYDNEGMVEVLLRETAVSRCSQVRSLLHYLRERLVFKFGVRHMKPAQELGLHDEGSWHVSPQTRGLYAKRQGLSVPLDANYVECTLSTSGLSNRKAMKSATLLEGAQ